MSNPSTAFQPDQPHLASRPFWPAWLEGLRGMGVEQAAAAMLEGAGPLGLIAAQLVYLGRPFLGSQANALAHMLEDQNETQAFAAFLRGEDIR